MGSGGKNKPLVFVAEPDVTQYEISLWSVQVGSLALSTSYFLLTWRPACLGVGWVEQNEERASCEAVQALFSNRQKTCNHKSKPEHLMGCCKEATPARSRTVCYTELNNSGGRTVVFNSVCFCDQAVGVLSSNLPFLLTCINITQSKCDWLKSVFWGNISWNIFLNEIFPVLLKYSNK